MGYTSQRVNGTADQVGGKVRSTVGAIFGNDRLRASGKLQEYRGTLTVAAAKAAQRILAQAELLIGSLKTSLGALIDNDELRVKGAADKAEGHARDIANS